MELCLVGKADPRDFNERDCLQVFRLERQVLGELGVALKFFPFILREVPYRGVEVAGNPSEVTGQVFLADDLVDLVDGGPTGFPCGLSMVTLEMSLELVKSGVGDVREMRGRAPGVHPATAIALQQGNRTPCFLE
jgi:hypothetical protein